MRQDHFTYLPQFKLFMAGNHKPGLRSVDEAIKARFNLIPFVVTVPKEKRDERLTEKLKAEGPAILQWAIEGCLDWQQIKLRPPPMVAEATNDYFEAEDAIRIWLDECCDTSSTYENNLSETFASWCGWAARSGEAAGTKKAFIQKLETKRCFVRPGSGNVKYVTGLRIRPKNENRYDNENGGEDDVRW
jgi:putative DNA primase/helicase